MKFLIFSQHFPPETMATGRRACDLAESLASRGHDVTVITGLPNHPSSQGRPFCCKAAHDEHSCKGHRILRVPVFRSADARTLKRFLTYATFMLSAAGCGIRQQRPDAILAVSPLPTGLAAMLAHWWHRAPLIFDLQDIWPDAAIAVGMMQATWLLRLLRHIEHFFYQRCAQIVGISEGFKHYLKDLGLPPERVKVIQNGVDSQKFLGAPPDKHLRQSQSLAGKFVVGYIGNLGLAQGLDTLIDAAARLRDHPVSFLLVGEGVDKQRLVASVQARRLNNVHFLDGVPSQEVPPILAACDALLVMLRDVPVLKATIPSKTYEYMAAGKPILCAAEGEAASLVREARCGLVVRPSSGPALVRGIQTFLHHRTWCSALGEAGARWVRSRFDRSTLMDAYEHMLDGLVNGEAQAPATSFPSSLERNPSVGTG